MKGRKDKWTDEEQTILEKIVLEHIQTGSTKTAAFKQAAAVLGRTQAACGYRWNHVLSKKNTTVSTTAQLQLPPPKDYKTTSTTDLTLDMVIQFLQNLKTRGISDEQYEERVRLLAEQDRLKQQQTMLKERLDKKKGNYQELLQQYETFTKVLNESEELIGGRVPH